MFSNNILSEMNFISLMTFVVTVGASLDFKVIDLTHTIGPNVLTFPFNLPYNMTSISKGYNERYKIWLEDNYICMPEHILHTSVDAPGHMVKNKELTHQIPLDKLIGPGVIINVKRKAAENPNYKVTVRDLQMWEKRFGKIPDGALVLMNSGWDRRYPDSKLVYNTKNVSNPDTYSYPSWSVEAGEWLLKNRRIIGVGVDTPTIDVLSGETLPVHIMLFTRSLIALEGVANLDSVPPSGSTIFIPVLKTFNGTGGPSRVFATVPKRKYKK